MALPLPTIESVKDCASFSHTVLPFLSQLTVLPERLQLAATAKDVVILKDIYLSTNPFVSALGFSLLLSAWFLVFSEITRNYSQVDRLWSLLPALYNVHFAVWARMSGLRTQSLDTIAVLTVIWSIRLTYNYWRKGGYKIGGEDYRWEVIRTRIPNRAVFFLFNITFISVIQSLLLLLLAAPTYNFVLLSQRPDLKSFELPDLAFSRVAFFFLIIEFFADQQQWHFHCAKREYHDNARISGQYKDQFTQEDLERGFAVTGLWSLSRHPNFVAEQAIWLSLYLWNCYRTESFVQWTGLGFVGLFFIFQGSVRLTESISASKYPEYADYQARVGRFIPRLSVESRSKYRAPTLKNKQFLQVEKKLPTEKKKQTEQASEDQENKKAQ